MQTINVEQFGAAGDGKTLCTSQIQRAIDACEKDGTVYIPKGTFLSGALFLKSHMTLYLEEGARLQGSAHAEDYPVKGYPYEGLDQLCYASLIGTDSAPHKNITIAGKGVIDAGGAVLFKEELRDSRIKRGRAVCIRNAENVKITGVTIRQSPAWCLHLIYCKNVEIDGIQVHTKYDENGNTYDIFNGDGIDVDSCQDVVIRNCLIASEDDGIAVKSGRNEEGRRAGVPSRNILIENCKFPSGFGVAVGSEMSGGVEDVYVRSCTFENAYSIASVKAIRGRGSYIRNVHYENCTIKNHSTEFSDGRYFRGAVYLDGFYGEEEFNADEPVPVDEGTPVVEDIYFKDLIIDTVAGNAIYLCGLPERHFRNVYLENIVAHGRYGMKVKNIDNLQQVNVQVTYDEESGEI